MIRWSVPGLGSFVMARESLEDLICNAGRLNSEMGRGSALLAPRRSKALLGRRLCFSGKWKRVERIRGCCGVVAGLDMCFECLTSGLFDVYWVVFAVLRLSIADDSGFKDFVRDPEPNGEMFGL
jgi:hypothetical protein